MNKCIKMLCSSAFAALGVLCLPALAAAASKFTLPSGVQVVIDEQSFDQTGATIVSCGLQQAACIIDGKLPFGASLEVPESYVKSISVYENGTSFRLDCTSMYNAWGKRPLEVKGSIRYFGGGCTDKDDCRFRGIFSDGAGSFVAEWAIVAGHVFRTVLTDSSDVMGLFRDHIDPPAIE